MTCYNPENYKTSCPPTRFKKVPVAFETVRIPASLGDSTTYPPKLGMYTNKVVKYEADGTVWLYDSCGNFVDIPSGDITAMVTSVNGKVGKVVLKISDLENDEGYITLEDVGNGVLTVQRNSEDIGKFSANSMMDQTVDIKVPTAVSELENDAGYATTAQLQEETNARTEVDADLQEGIDNLSNLIDREVLVDIQLSSDPSTSIVKLNAAKANLKSGGASEYDIPLPVASAAQAGVMNSATFNAVAKNSADINALLNGAVAVTGLDAAPTQEALAEAWESETGLADLINRASIYDVTNDKVWTYYTNDSTWHAASNTTQVSVNTFTNTAEGTIKGSTNVGQVFAENDGTGSVNGWDSLVADVAAKQPALVSGTNIKTINSNSVLGTGNLTTNDIVASSSITSAKLGSSAVTTAKIATSAVTKAKIAADAVGNAEVDWANIDLSSTMVNSPVFSYSTSEKRTGMQWIDGKWIYCRVFTGDLLEGLSTTVINTGFASSAVNVLPMSCCALGPQASSPGYSGVGSVWWWRYEWFDVDGSIVLRIFKNENWNPSRGDGTFKAIMYYTKN